MNLRPTQRTDCMYLVEVHYKNARAGLKPVLPYFTVFRPYLNFLNHAVLRARNDPKPARGFVSVPPFLAFNLSILMMTCELRQALFIMRHALFITTGTHFCPITCHIACFIPCPQSFPISCPLYIPITCPFPCYITCPFPCVLSHVISAAR